MISASRSRSLQCLLLVLLTATRILIEEKRILPFCPPFLPLFPASSLLRVECRILYVLLVGRGERNEQNRIYTLYIYMFLLIYLSSLTEKRRMNRSECSRPSIEYKKKETLAENREKKDKKLLSISFSSSVDLHYYGKKKEREKEEHFPLMRFLFLKYANYRIETDDLCVECCIMNKST